MHIDLNACRILVRANIFFLLCCKIGMFTFVVNHCFFQDLCLYFVMQEETFLKEESKGDCA